jgi:hypothetical protein
MLSFHAKYIMLSALTHSIFMLIVMLCCCAEGHQAKCRYSNCCHAEYNYVEFHYTKCYIAGFHFLNVIIL